MSHEHDKVLILDFGSQFTQLIARRIREERVFCEIHPPTRTLDWIRAWGPKAVILSGGPASVYDEGVPSIERGLLEAGMPVLGICYGMQLIALLEGAKVEQGKREYGRAELDVGRNGDLFAGFDPGESTTVWCSHGDHVLEPPPGYETLASTKTLPVAAFADRRRKIYGVQFHPEVAHTHRGDEILSNFLFEVAGCRPTWTAGAFIEDTIERIREQIGDRQTICGLSGGVDSSVAAVLVHRAIGDRLTCIFVDHGLLRKHEREQVERMFRSHYDMRLVVEDASKAFLSDLDGVVDPEEKRKAIGGRFIEVFRDTAEREGTEAAFLGDTNSNSAAACTHRLPYPSIYFRDPGSARHPDLPSRPESAGRTRCGISGRIPGAGDAVPRRDRIRIRGWAVRHDQDAPQRRWAARGPSVRARGAPPRALQGRGEAGRPRAGPPGGLRRAPSVSGARVGHPDPG